MTINVVLPVLNEDIRLENGLRELMRFLETNNDINCKITIADNGSDSEHMCFAKRVVEKYDNVEYIYIPEKGVGGAFQAAIGVNNCDIIGYMDVDMATPPKYLSEVLEIFSESRDIEIINASRLLKESSVIGRSLLREITSRVLNKMIHAVFKTGFTDAMCSFKFFRKETLANIIKYASNDRSWFYCAELLIYAEKLGYNVYEIPVQWHDMPGSKVRVISLARQYLRRIIRIRRDLREKRCLQTK